MNTEFEVLKKIFQARNGVSIKLISNHLGFGVDYIRFICKKLEEKNLVKSKERDWYVIAPRGKGEFERRGLIKKSLRKKGPKMKSSVWQVVKMKETPSSQPSKIKPDFEKTKEGYNLLAAQKLKIGKKIEKAAAFLRNFRRV